MFYDDADSNVSSQTSYRHALPIDRARHREKGQPLCMEQYYRLFSSYRQPGEVKDKLLTVDTMSLGAEHITVVRNNQVSTKDTTFSCA